MTKSELYDILYDLGSELFVYDNPCDWKNGACMRDRLEPYRKAGYCCAGCKYISKKGCTTRALGCKLHACSVLENKYPTIRVTLEYLRRIAYKSGIGLSIRQSKEELLK